MCNAVTDYKKVFIQENKGIEKCGAASNKTLMWCSPITDIIYHILSYGITFFVRIHVQYT